MAHRMTIQLGAGLAAALSAAAPALAQNLSSNSAEYNSGYGRSNGSENSGVTLSGSRDANGNRSIIDGIMQTGASTVSARASAYASADVTGGVGGSGSSTAVGNSLTVITQGNYNTVVVNSVQTNTGNVSAIVSGGVGE